MTSGGVPGQAGRTGRARFVADPKGRAWTGRSGAVSGAPSGSRELPINHLHEGRFALCRADGPDEGVDDVSELGSEVEIRVGEADVDWRLPFSVRVEEEEV